MDINEALRSPRRRPLSRLPAIVVRSIGLVWQAAPREFVWSTVLQAVAGGSVAVQLLAGRAVLDHVLDGHGMSRAAPALALVVGATALIAFANVARSEQQRVLAELVARHAIDKVLDVATRVPLVAYETPGFHDRLERAKINAVVRPANVATGVIGLLSAGFAIVGIGGALWLIQPWFLALVVIAYIPAWLATARASRATHDFSVAQTERDRRRTYLLMLLTGKAEAQEVRSFDLGDFLRDQHDDLYRSRIRDLRDLAHRRLRLGLTGSVLTSALTGTTVLLLLWMLTSDRISVAAAGTAAGGVMLLGQRLHAVAGAAGALYEGSLFVDDFTSFIDDVPPPQPVVQGSVPEFGRVAVRGLTFTYPSRQRPTLRDVSLDVGVGEVVALVGENGSGKTTLAKLLAGLYEPDSGTISWDDVEITDDRPRAVHDAVAVIFQDFVRYHLTIRENIAMGRHECYTDADRVEHAARRAQIHDHLATLEEGYDTRMGPHFLGGRDLSIGQWQRVALARAFFRNAPFVILDEPTASLDPRAEAALFDDIRSLCEARSVLLISHRFASVRSADRIYVMHEGRIVEHGTHNDLLADGGRYAQLFRMQAARYLDRTRAMATAAP